MTNLGYHDIFTVTNKRLHHWVSTKVTVLFDRPGKLAGWQDISFCRGLGANSVKDGLRAFL